MSDNNNNNINNNTDNNENNNENDNHQCNIPNDITTNNNPNMEKAEKLDDNIFLVTSEENRRKQIGIIRRSINNGHSMNIDFDSTPINLCIYYKGKKE